LSSGAAMSRRVRARCAGTSRHGRAEACREVARAATRALSSTHSNPDAPGAHHALLKRRSFWLK